MKYLKYLVVVSLVAGISLPVFSLCASTPSLPPLPQVPITYPGDTDQTIARRAGWVEAAKKEGKLVWWGTVKVEGSRELLSEFNKVYPFIEVDYWYAGLGAEQGTRLEAEFVGGRNRVDLVLMGEPQRYPKWREVGMIEKFTDIIIGIEKLNKGMYSRHGDWAIPGNNAIIPQYNTKLVSAAEAPKSWEDLLNPKWKGQIAMRPDMKLWWQLALGEGGWGIPKTDQYLSKLREQKPILTASESAAHSLLIAGEFKLNIDGFLPHVFVSQQKGAPVDWCRVNPIALIGTSILVLKKAHHPHAARLFVEWMFSPQGLALYEKVSGYGAVYPGSTTRMAKAVQSLKLVYRTDELVLKAQELRLDDRFAGILGILPEQ